MKKLKFSKKEYNLARSLVLCVRKELLRLHPKLVNVDSNLFHFIIYRVYEKHKLGLARGWFRWGPYLPIVDDVLIDLKFMDKSQHQMYGNETPLTKPIICNCHTDNNRDKRRSA